MATIRPSGVDSIRLVGRGSATLPIPDIKEIRALETCADARYVRKTLQVFERVLSDLQNTAALLTPQRAEILACCNELNRQNRKFRDRELDRKCSGLPLVLREFAKELPAGPSLAIHKFLTKKSSLPLSASEEADLRKMVSQLPADEQNQIYLSYFNFCFSHLESSGVIKVSDGNKVQWAKTHLSDQGLFAAEDIRVHYERLSPEDRSKLTVILTQIAKDDGVPIEDWDADWGMYHLYGDTPSSSWSWRLARGLHQLEMEKREKPSSGGQFLQEVFSKALLTKVETLSSEDQKRLSHLLREIAIHEDGLPIEGWDLDWGRYHLTEDISDSSWSSRLVRALEDLETDKKVLTLSSYFHGIKSEINESVANQFIRSSPLFEDLRLGKCLALTDHQTAELRFRTAVIKDLHNTYESLAHKYPILSSLSQGFKDIKLYLVLNPNSLNEDPKLHARLSWIFRVCEQLRTTDCDPETALFVMQQMLSKTCFSVSNEEICSSVSLRDLSLQAVRERDAGILQKAPEKVGKDIYFTEDRERGVKAKVKVAPVSLSLNERASYACDVISGFRMTTPTMIKMINPHIPTIRKLIKQLSSSKAADREMALKGISELPADIQNSLYGHTYELYGEGKHIDDYGSVLWHMEGFPVENKIAVLRRYLAHFEVMTVQLWIQGPSLRAFDMVREDVSGGEKIRRMPKVFVHALAVLDIIKGSKDSSCGNSMFMLRGDGSIGGIKEFDDEYTFPEANTFHQMRLWELGLPQADKPFDKAVLMLFTDDSFLPNLMAYAKISGLSAEAQESLYQRVTAMIRIFHHELGRTATLTPRDLYFALFGGKEVYDSLIAAGGNPWESFEFGLADHAKGFPAWGSEYWERVKENFATLFRP